MSQALAIQIADAVVNLLNEETFTQAFTAERAWRPLRELKDLESVEVLVIPVLIGITGNDRGTDTHDYAVEVGIFKKVESEAPEFVDPWVDFAQELTDRLREKGGIETPRASYLSIENDPIVAGEYLQKNIFASLITVNFRLWR